MQYTADMQNQHSSEEGIANTTQLSSIIATSCDIIYGAAMCVLGMLYYATSCKWRTYIYMLNTIVMLPIHVLFVRAHLF